jgi:hypothetical protein
MASGHQQDSRGRSSPAGVVLLQRMVVHVGRVRRAEPDRVPHQHAHHEDAHRGRHHDPERRERRRSSADRRVVDLYRRSSRNLTGLPTMETTVTRTVTETERVRMSGNTMTRTTTTRREKVVTTR